MMTKMLFLSMEFPRIFYYFFWAKLCVIDDIILHLNGQGEVVFRLRAEADFLAGKFIAIAIEEAKIKLERNVWNSGNNGERGNCLENQNICSRRSINRE